MRWVTLYKQRGGMDERGRMPNENWITLLVSSPLFNGNVMYYSCEAAKVNDPSTLQDIPRPWLPPMNGGYLFVLDRILFSWRDIYAMWN